MKRLPCFVLGFIAILFVAAKEKQSKVTPPTADQIQQWIKQLGNESYKVREKATQDLIKAGRVTINAMTTATKSDDPEVKQRALLIIKEIRLNDQLRKHYEKLARAGGPPSDDEVKIVFYWAYYTVDDQLPLMHEVKIKDVRIVTELVPDSYRIDSLRHYPLIGPARLHHVRYKSVVNFTKVTRVSWPIPHTLEEEEKNEVVYIDRNHLHIVGCINPGCPTRVKQNAKAEPSH